MLCANLRSFLGDLAQTRAFETEIFGQVRPFEWTRVVVDTGCEDVLEPIMSHVQNFNKHLFMHLFFFVIDMLCSLLS